MKQDFRFCQNCGFKNSKSASFCGRCGERLGPKKVLGDMKKISLFGIIGSILILLTPVSSIGFIIAIVGFVFVGVALYTLSKKLNFAPIFKNYVLSLVILAIGVAIAVVYLVLVLSSPANSSLITQLINSNSTTISTSLQSSTIQNLIIPVILALVILVAALVISAIFFRRSFKAIAEKTGVHLFDTTASVYLAGAALTIVFGLGLIVIFVAFILQAISFFYLGYRKKY